MTAIEVYLNVILTVGLTPDIPEPDKAYYPQEGATYSLKATGDKYKYVITGNEDHFPEGWANSTYTMLEAGEGKGPFADHKRLHAKVKLVDTNFDVWFFVNGKDKFVCETLSIPNSDPDAKSGGYIHR